MSQVPGYFDGASVVGWMDDSLANEGSFIIDTLNSLQQNRSLIFNPNTLIGLAQRGMPRVVEISLDSRREIDRELKRICENFISDCVHGAVEPLTNFTIKVSNGDTKPRSDQRRREATKAYSYIGNDNGTWKDDRERQVCVVLKKAKQVRINTFQSL